MSLPKAFIVWLPFSAIILSQTVPKATSSHVFFRCSCRMQFFAVLPLAVVTCSRSPSDMIFAFLSSCTITFASASPMNRCRKRSRTCSAAQKKKSYNVHLFNYSCALYEHPPPNFSTTHSYCTCLSSRHLLNQTHNLQCPIAHTSWFFNSYCMFSQSRPLSCLLKLCKHGYHRPEQLWLVWSPCNCTLC